MNLIDTATSSNWYSWFKSKCRFLFLLAILLSICRILFLSALCCIFNFIMKFTTIGCVVKLNYRICEKQLPHIATVFCGKLMRWREKQHCHFLWSTWKDTTFSYALLFISIQRDQLYVLLHPVIAVLLDGWKKGLNCTVSYAGIANCIM